jgi:hypothetical protein
LTSASGRNGEHRPASPTVHRRMNPGHLKLTIEQPYAGDLDGILVFRSFADAEISIGRLEELRRRYAQAADKRGVEWCRRVAVMGRKRAGMISRDPRVDPLKRRRKAEISHWFQIWLETPELFGDWLAMRKKTGTYRELSDSGSADDGT